MACGCDRGGEGLLVLATLVSLQLAQGRTAGQLELLSSFFEVLGDDLALIAAQREAAEPERPCP